MRRITGVLGSVATLLMASHSAAICGAHVDAAHSTVPKCFVGCPAGDVPFTVVVRDAVGNPSVNAYVTLSFNYLSYIYCPPPKFCPIQEPGTWINGSGVNRTTDGSGTVTFHLAVGGLCPSATVYVTANGVPLGDLPVANFDQDGDLQVTAGDQALASAKVGVTDPSADFDCSGTVDSADIALLASHMGHTFDATTPVVRRSWGALKSIYR